MARTTIDKDMPETGADTVQVTVPSPAAKRQYASFASRLLAEQTAKRADMLKRARAAETKPVTLAPGYRKYLGNVARIELNGMPIFLPADGRQYDICKHHAALMHRKRRLHDAYEMRRTRMADVQNNFETHIGQLSL